MSIKNNLSFSSSDFNRQSLHRSNKNSIEQKHCDENSLFLLFWHNRFLCSDKFVQFLTKDATVQYSQSKLVWHYMGEMTMGEMAMNEPSTADNTKSVFAAEVVDATEKTEQATWQSLRVIGLNQTPEVANLLVYSQGLLNWHAKTSFCSNCGSTLSVSLAGHGLVCENEVCGKEIFPRTDPAVIVLIHHQDACLLGRAASWPEGVYSCLAGFVETGESLDAAVHREVYEESGVALSDITYIDSQPWPFPQSLMIGFHAEAKSRELTFHDGELQDAKWYTREQLVEAIKQKELFIVSTLSISYHLLEKWFNQQSDLPLAHYLNIHS